MTWISACVSTFIITLIQIANHDIMASVSKCDGDDPDHIMYKHVPVSVYVGHTGLVLKCEKTKKNRRRLEVTKIPDERLRRNCIKDGVENTIRIKKGNACVEMVDGGLERWIHFGKIDKGKSDGTYTCTESCHGQNNQRIKYKETIWNVTVLDLPTSPPSRAGAAFKIQSITREVRVGQKGFSLQCEKTSGRYDRRLLAEKSRKRKSLRTCQQGTIRRGRVCVESLDGGWYRKFRFGEIVKGKSDGVYTCTETYQGYNHTRVVYKKTVWNVIVIGPYTSGSFSTKTVTTASITPSSSEPPTYTEKSSQLPVSSASTVQDLTPSSTASADAHARSTSSGGNSSTTVVVASAVAVVFLVAVFLVVLAVLRRRFRLGESRGVTLVKKFSSRSKNKQWEFPREHLELIKELGSGFFGSVYEGKAYGITEPETWTSVAVKLANDGIGHSSLCDEVKLMSGLGFCPHKNVIRLLGICSVEGPLCLIVEHASHGNLKSYVQSARIDRQSEQLQSNLKSGLEITPYKMFNFGLQIASGMEHLMNRKILHCDLAARNVLVFENEILKICDFGMAKDVRYVNYYRDQSQGATPVRWMSPEAMFDKVYTQSSDVWSFGILLWEIATFGGSPYPGISVEQLYDLLTAKSYRMSCPVNCPPKLYDIMLWCWHADKTQRPTFSALVEQLSVVLNGLSEFCTTELRQ